MKKHINILILIYSISCTNINQSLNSRSRKKKKIIHNTTKSKYNNNYSNKLSRSHRVSKSGKKKRKKINHNTTIGRYDSNKLSRSHKVSKSKKISNLIQQLILRWKIILGAVVTLCTAGIAVKCKDKISELIKCFFELKPNKSKSNKPKSNKEHVIDILNIKDDKDAKKNNFLNFTQVLYLNELCNNAKTIDVLRQKRGELQGKYEELGDYEITSPEHLNLYNQMVKFYEKRKMINLQF